MVGVSYLRLAEALLQGRPYFGPALRSLQGPPERHQYILPVVKHVVSRSPIAILEIGSWAGASAISWASAIRRLDLQGRVQCVDSWLPYFDSGRFENSHYRRMNRAAENGTIYQLFQHNIACSGFADIIDATVGKSREILPALPAASFDIVYVDGSHMLDDARFDIREALRLVKSGGIVCGDDLELQAAELDAAELEGDAHSGEDYVFSTCKGEGYHPGVTLAVGAEIGPVNAWEGFWAVESDGETRRSVTLDLSVAEVPDHVASAMVTFEGRTHGHELISYRGKHFAFARSLGTPDLALELLGEDDLPPLVFTGNSIAEVREKMQRHDAESPAYADDPGSELQPVPKLVESYRGYNLVRFQNYAYGLRRSLGHVDVAEGNDALESRFSRRDAIIGDSLERIRAQVDLILAEESVEELSARALGNIAEAESGVQELTERLQKLKKQVACLSNASLRGRTL